MQSKGWRELNYEADSYRKPITTKTNEPDYANNFILIKLRHGNLSRKQTTQSTPIQTVTESNSWRTFRTKVSQGRWKITKKKNTNLITKADYRTVLTYVYCDFISLRERAFLIRILGCCGGKSTIPLLPGHKGLRTN